jgi:hypothetical protein
MITMKESGEMKMKPVAVLMASICLSLLSTTVTSAPIVPNPVLILTGTENLQSGEKHMVRYHFDVFNKSSYPAEMFAAAPDLPPCGKNAKSSRTWVDIFEQKGKRLYGSCIVMKPEDLNTIWFEVEEGLTPPSWVYIELWDRKTNTKYKSNLAETSP